MNTASKIGLIAALATGIAAGIVSLKRMNEQGNEARKGRGHTKEH